MFRLKCAIFTRYYAVNRTNFSAQLAYRQETWFKFYFYVWLIWGCSWRKKIIHCHVQLYSTTFRNRKSRQKIFAAQTPQRKRGYVEDFAYRNKLRLQNLKNSRFALSLKLRRKIAARQARGWGWFLSKICLSQL